MGHHDIKDNEIGKVTDVKGDYAYVELDSNDACSSCAARILCRPNDDNTKRQMKILNTAAADVGDSVTIISNDKNMFKFLFMQYGLPLAGFLTGIFLGYAGTGLLKIPLPAEIISFATGLLTMIIMGFITRRWSDKQAADETIYFQTGSVISD